MSINSPQTNNHSPIVQSNFQNILSPLSSYQPNTIGQRSSLSGTPLSTERGTSGNNRGSKRGGVHDGGGFEFINENENFTKMNGDVKRSKSNPKLTKAQEIEQLIGANALSDVSNMVTAVAEERLRRLASPHTDLIERGIITLEEAQQRLDLYFDSLFSKYPFVEIPSSVETLRADYPVLFNVVLAVTCVATSSPDDFDKNLEIENIAIQQVIHEIVIIGNKSIELLKSLLLLTLWYNVPELFHHRRYHILSSLSISMTQDLGLTGRPYYVVNKTEGSVLRSEMLEDPQKDEYKCLVLAVYASSIGYSLFLRRRLFATWSPYLEECYQHLRLSSEQKFRTVAIFAKLSSLLEKIHSFVEAKDEENLSFIKHFEKAIDFLKDQPTSLDSDVLLGFAYSVEAFLYSKFTSVELTYKCLHATLRCLHHFSSLSAQQFSAVPLIIYGRLMYCFALLLKTSNSLGFEFDFSSIKKIMSTLDECNRTYKTNHMLAKTKLLFYFYLTTYSKNENAFNELANVPSSDTIIKANSQNSSLHGTPTNSSSSQQQQSQHPVPTQSNTFPQQQHPLPIPQPLPQQQNVGDIPNIPLHATQPPPYGLHDGGTSTSHQPPINISNVASHQYSHHPSQHQILNHLSGPPPPQPQEQQGQQQQPTNAYPGLNISNTNSMLQQQQLQHDQLESHMEPVYPQLDILSDATMKGFGSIPTELMGQDEFWKLFDYKDEQFLL